MNDDILNKLFNKYKLIEHDQEEILFYIKKIYEHPEFQKRLTDSFPHHDRISLGEHILEDMIVSYKLSQKHLSKNFDLKAALYIAMFHDLYTEPWQNSSIKDKKFTHKHGFRHPIEAAINAINWFPECFNDDQTASKIIDGVIHHMYPLPVCCLSSLENNMLELRNFNSLQNIDDRLISYIIESSNRCKIMNLSVSSPKFLEGKVMSKADKIVSISNFKKTSFSSKMALLNGKNKKI